MTTHFFIGYILEYKLATGDSWNKVATVESGIKQYCFEKLKQKSDVILRVTAENVVGIGSSSVTEVVRLHKHASE